MKIHVFIGMFGGLVNVVRTFTTAKEAIITWEKYTGVSWKKYEKSHYDAELLSEKYEGSTIYESEIEESNRNKKYCAWTIEDPMSMYPEMSEDQAVAVMNLVERRADYDIGVTYGSIRDAVDCLYPDMKSVDVDEEEDN